MKRRNNNRINTEDECNKGAGSSDETEDTKEVVKFHTEKIKKLREELKLLTQGKHQELIKATVKKQAWLKDQEQCVRILHEQKVGDIHREYSKEIEACVRDCELEKKKVQDYLVSLCEELKCRLEHDKKNIELTPSGDVLDLKPAVTRKLRRRGAGGGGNAGCGDFINTMNTSAGGPTNGASFGYWGDLMLCSSAWPLATTTGLRSPVTTGSHNLAMNGGSNDGVDISVGEPDKQAGVNFSPNTASRLHQPGATRLPPAGGVNSNLFGSLGIDLADGSLLSHLVTSLNASGSCTTTFGSGLFNGLAGGAGSFSVALAGFAGISGSAAAATSAGSGAAALAALLPGLSANVVGQTGTGSATVVGVGAGGPAGLGAVSGLPVGVGGKRRRNQNQVPMAQLNLLLPETDIYSDLTAIHRACGKLASAGGGSSSRKSGNVGEGRVGGRSHGGLSAVDGSGERVAASGTVSVWIDDGRLYYKQKCYQQGNMVVLEGRDGSSHGCTGVISSVGVQEVVIRRSSDHGISRVNVHQLRSGRFVLAPAKRI